VRLGTASLYYSGPNLELDAFLSRSLFDLYSNFTFFRDDPVHGEAFQQHDSRLQQGLNAQYTRAHHISGAAAVMVAGANFHDNEINVGLYPRAGRRPTGVTTRDDAHVTNAAGYAQESVSLLSCRERAAPPGPRRGAGRDQRELWPRHQLRGRARRRAASEAAAHRHYRLLPGRRRLESRPVRRERERVSHRSLP
jgi:hypothetical protein